MITTIGKIEETTFALEDFLASPFEHQEWIDGKLKETTGMTILHSKIQAKLSRLLGNYIKNTNQDGEIYTELPCKTTKQGRRPDIAYLTLSLVEEYGSWASLPQSPPFIVEIISPPDSAEELFAKADEYLASGCEEVWLVFPESKKVVTLTQEKTSIFDKDQFIKTDKYLPGFTIGLQDLFG